MEVTLEEEAVREAGAVVVVDGARLRGRAGPVGAFADVVGIERMEEIARRAGRLDVCLCWEVGVGRACGWLALSFEVVGLSLIKSSFSALHVSCMLGVRRANSPSGASSGTSHRDGLPGEAKPVACQTS